jgi:hypothetical protein
MFGAPVQRTNVFALQCKKGPQQKDKMAPFGNVEFDFQRFNRAVSTFRFRLPRPPVKI